MRRADTCLPAAQAPSGSRRRLRLACGLLQPTAAQALSSSLAQRRHLLLLPVFGRRCACMERRRCSCRPLLQRPSLQLQHPLRLRRWRPLRPWRLLRCLLRPRRLRRWRRLLPRRRRRSLLGLRRARARNRRRPRMRSCVVSFFVCMLLCSLAAPEPHAVSCRGNARASITPSRAALLSMRTRIFARHHPSAASRAPASPMPADALPKNLPLHIFWAAVLLAVTHMAAKAAETVAAKSLEAAKMTGETAVRASEATGARAAAALATALAEPARRSAEAAEKLADAVQDLRRDALLGCAAQQSHDRRHRVTWLRAKPALLSRLLTRCAQLQGCLRRGQLRKKEGQVAHAAPEHANTLSPADNGSPCIRRHDMHRCVCLRSPFSCMHAPTAAVQRTRVALRRPSPSPASLRAAQWHPARASRARRARRTAYRPQWARRYAPEAP